MKKLKKLMDKFYTPRWLTFLIFVPFFFVMPITIASLIFNFPYPYIVNSARFDNYSEKVDELKTNFDLESSSSLVKEMKKVDNLNYIETDSVNAANIFIPVNRPNKGTCSYIYSYLFKSASTTFQLKENLQLDFANFFQKYERDEYVVENLRKSYIFIVKLSEEAEILGEEIDYSKYKTSLDEVDYALVKIVYRATNLPDSRCE